HRPDPRVQGQTARADRTLTKGVKMSISNRTAMTDKAWIARSPNRPLVLEPIDLGPLGAEEVEVAVEHCGLRQADLSVLHDDCGITQYPAVLGHEITGRLTAVGSRA